MTLSTYGNVRAFIPSEENVQVAQESSRALASYVHSQEDFRKIRVIENGTASEAIAIPSEALQLLIEILAQIAKGNAVTLIPIHAELTTQEAADVLNVSRPHFVELLESGQIPYRKVGRRRKVRYQDVMNYKHKIDAERMKVLDVLAAEAQEFKMGYD